MRQAGCFADCAIRHARSSSATDRTDEIIARSRNARGCLKQVGYDAVIHDDSVVVSIRRMLTILKDLRDLVFGESRLGCDHADRQPSLAAPHDDPDELLRRVDEVGTDPLCIIVFAHVTYCDTSGLS